jgi:hypothetical protein
MMGTPGSRCSASSNAPKPSTATRREVPADSSVRSASAVCSLLPHSTAVTEEFSSRCGVSAVHVASTGSPAAAIASEYPASSWRVR